MKKLMFALVAAGAAAVMGEEIASQNTVGYATIDVAANQIIGLGVQFNDAVTENTVAVKDLVTVSEPKGANGLGDTADQIWNWENNEWTKYFYRSRGTTVYGWVKYNPSGTQPTEPTTDTLGNGESIFFKRASGGAATLTLSGAVNLGANSVSTAVAANQIIQLANPWPVPFAISNMVDCIAAADRKGANGLGDTADQIWIWENNAWTKYFYRSRGTTVYGWVKYNSSGTQPTEPTTDTIAVGQGFFFKRASGGAATVTFTKPAGL